MDKGGKIKHEKSTQLKIFGVFLIYFRNVLMAPGFIYFLPAFYYETLSRLGKYLKWACAHATDSLLYSACVPASLVTYCCPDLEVTQRGKH